MSSMRTKFLAAAVVAGAIAMATPAFAGPIVISNVGLIGVTITLSGGILPHEDQGNPTTTLAGDIVLTTDIGTLNTFCVDLFHNISLGGSYVYEPVPFTTENDGTSPSDSTPLTADQMEDIAGLAAEGAATTGLGGDWEAAIQAAIWEIEYGVTATGDPIFEADLAFVLANYESWDGGGYEIGNPTAQGLFVDQQLFVSAPEPMTIALFGAGLIGFGALRRRRKPTA